MEPPLLRVIPPSVNPEVSLVPENIAVESIDHPATVPATAAAVALIVASDVLSTLPKPTFALVVPARISASDVLSTLPKPTSAASPEVATSAKPETSEAAVLEFNVLVASKVVVPICRVPENVPLAPVISPLKNAFPDVSI